MPAAVCSTLFAVAAAEAAPQPISVQTALLLILGLGLLLTAKSVADLRRRVDTLTAALRSKSLPTPAALPPEIVAVIAAAVAETLESDHRIVTISGAHHDNASWSQEGRRQVFAGRKVR